MKQILEGSNAIAQVINNIKPNVVSAYPITPQTHIVEDLAKLKADGLAKFEYVRAESEFAAASIVAGASATGVRVYTATSSQGLLLMAEVVFNIAGMRLPVVMTCANRGVSAPITIWNDHQDAMTVRDAGWVMLFAENHQEAVEQHILAYRIAESLKVPVMVNIDGFVLTHTYEEVYVPSAEEIKKFLPDYEPTAGEYLDTKNPVTLGAFAAPPYYMEIREDLHKTLHRAKELILKQRDLLAELIPEAAKPTEKNATINNGLLEYYGTPKADTIFIALGSLAGTVKDTVDEMNKKKVLGGVAVVKIKTFRPFPDEDLLKLVHQAKYITVLEKAISLGASAGPLALEVKACCKNKCKAKVQDFVVGLGGRDITKAIIAKAAALIKKSDDKTIFIGN